MSAAPPSGRSSGGAGPGAPRRGAKAALLRLAGLLETIIETIGRWIAWTCLFLVMLVATNVIFRYFLHIGPVSLQELEWHLMSPIALIGMSYCMFHQEHVRVDIFYEKYSPTTRNLVDLAAAIATVVISIIIIDLSLGFIAQSYASGEISPDPGGLHYRWLLKSFIPFGFLLLALQGLAQVLRCGCRAFLGGARG